MKIKKGSNRNSPYVRKTLAKKSRIIIDSIGGEIVKSVYMEQHWNTVYIDEHELKSSRKSVETKTKSLRDILGDF